MKIFSASNGKLVSYNPMVVTVTCPKCGNKYYYESGIPFSRSCPKCETRLTKKVSVNGNIKHV